MARRDTPRIERTGSWTVANGLDETRQMVLAHMEGAGWKPRASEGEDLAFQRGSQVLTRIIGGWILPASKSPSRANVSLEGSEGAVTVDASFGEAVGIGTLYGVKKKFDAYLGSCVVELGAALGG